ncbi:MAG: serpin family protein [Bacilli bacterium]|jgi:serine protease inhibitor
MNYRKRYKNQAAEILDRKTPELNFEGKVIFNEPTPPTPKPVNKWALYVPVFSGVAALGIVLSIVLWPKGYDAMNPPEYYMNVPYQRSAQQTWTRGTSLDVYNQFVADYSPLVFESEEAFDARSFSPVDAFVNVAILGYVSTGTLQSEILTALGIDTVEQLNQVTKDVIDILGSGAGYSLNSFWYDDGIYALREGSDNILEVLSSHYYSNVISRRPTTDLVNEWLDIYVPKQRFPVVPQVELDPNGADAAIVSSYFAKSSWASESAGDYYREQYDSKTHKMTFHGDATEEVDYIEHGGRKIILDYCQGIEISLKDMNINFFLPDVENSVAGIFPSVVQGDYETADYATGEIPYFKIDNRLGLIPSLQEYGIGSITTASAAQGLLNSDETYVTSIEQFSTMSFDFGGLYSASVTVTQMNETSAGDFAGYDEIIFDRPFAFTASYHGATILVGQVYNPKY